ncbi:GDSL-like Lipase/Acylhydrolase [Zalerion maritima]|uniref:GDSL-like Lipase/Acylhydrolase n=1 Tax=Zalerion maritima TaxID=339359 RepID=A0AAD5RSM0_9PEZI|nr:GDSL-like Lipase/Acylhydrolase [Zalerion maritima]
MKFSFLSSVYLTAAVATSVSGTILDNGHPRDTNFIDTLVDVSGYELQTYGANATEISYKGRWDSKHMSWWTAPGLRFGFTGDTVAITFGNHTVDSTLVAYRIGGMDWQFSNVTARGTHLFVTSETEGVNETTPFSPIPFEMRVTNWGYGVQIDKVHVAQKKELVKLDEYRRTVEFIGDSLSSGMYNSYEGISGFAYGVGAGLGETEFSITAYPGICVADQDCWGNPRGQSHQWFYASDTSGRAREIWGDDPEPWDFSAHPAADLVIINIGTNDQNEANNVSRRDYVEHYKKLIQGVHGKWPDAQVVMMSLWLGFYQSGNSFFKVFEMDDEIKAVHEYFNSRSYLDNPVVWDGTTNATTTLNPSNSAANASAKSHAHSRAGGNGRKRAKPFVHIFNTTGILQHGDIGPQWHPTDVGQIKVAFSLMQYVRMTFGWELELSGPELFHETLYWNDQSDY